MMRSTYNAATVLLVIVSLFWLQACDSGMDAVSDTEGQVETLNLKLEDGSVFAVQLDPDLIQEQKAFETLEELEKYVAGVDEQGEVTLNKGLYLRFKHALSPSEISALDMEGVSIVGDYRYVISEETISKQDLTVPNASLEVETYHGENGKVYLDEFALIARNLGQLDKLSSEDFKDPEMRALFIQMKDGSVGKVVSTDQLFVGPVATRDFNFATPNGPITGTSYTHDKGYNIWNQSVGGWSKKALAYTSIVYRPQGTSTWYNYNYGNYGLYPPPSSDFVRSRAHGGQSPETCEAPHECQASAKRSGGVGAWSYHWGGFRGLLPPPSTGYLYIYDMENQYLN